MTWESKFGSHFDPGKYYFSTILRTKTLIFWKPHYEVVQELFVHYFNYDSFLHYPIHDALLWGPADGLKGKISAGFDFKFQPSLRHLL